jgi:chromate transporter
MFMVCVGLVLSNYYSNLIYSLRGKNDSALRNSHLAMATTDQMPAAARQDPTSCPAIVQRSVAFSVETGFICFGEPSGQIAMMHSELVEKHRWIDNEYFLHALNFCMLIPGPEAQ